MCNRGPGDARADDEHVDLLFRQRPLRERVPVGLAMQIRSARSVEAGRVARTGRAQPRMRDTVPIVRSRRAR
jgi:hypothetical protein